MIIVLVGLPLAGKSTALEAAKEMGIKSVQSGDIIREEIATRGLEYTKENDKMVAQWFHDGREEELVRRVLEKADVNLESDHLVIDGFRDVKQLDLLEEIAGQRPYVISVIADFDVRLERALRRKRFPDVSKEYLEDRDETERKRGLDGIMAQADVVIDTTDLDVDAVKTNVRIILNEVLS